MLRPPQSFARFGLVFAALLLLFGAVIRILGLDDNPPGLWQDEASTGVDAFLLWTTGKDRAGVFLPIAARSFGDYPLTLYRYLDAPIVGLFGLSVATERIVAAITGSFLVAATGLVTWRRTSGAVALAVLATSALCPTWIHFSRYGSEAILLPGTLVTGWALIDLGRDPRRRGAIWAGAFVLAASAYTYHAVKLFLPLWMIGFLLFQKPLILKLWEKERRHLVGPALLFTIAVGPSVYTALTPEGLARPNTVVAWKHYDGALEIARVVVNNYLSYFDPGMLFVRGGPAVAQSMPGLGLWNLIELPLMVAALVAIVRGTGPDRRFFAFLLFWFLLGPLPGGITYETQNVGRAIGWLPAPQILSGFGMVVLLRWVQAQSAVHRWVAVVPALLAVGWLATAVHVTRVIFSVYPEVTQRDFQHHITGAMRCAKKNRKDEKLIVSPHFQVASVFAMFHFSDVPKDAWTLGERTTVPEGELYLFPAHRPKPRRGREVCVVTLQRTGTPVSYVYGHAPKDQAEEE